MSDPTILFVKPKAISQRDKKMLSNAGVLIVEIDDPASAKFVRAAAEVSSTEMLAADCAVIYDQSSTATRENFAKAICQVVLSKRTPGA